MKLAMPLIGIGLLLLAWMFRYEVSGHVGYGDQTERPVMLDRWTGKTYVYYVNTAEMQIIGGWVQTKPEPEWMRNPLVKPQ